MCRVEQRAYFTTHKPSGVVGGLLATITRHRCFILCYIANIAKFANRQNYAILVPLASVPHARPSLAGRSAHERLSWMSFGCRPRSGAFGGGPLYPTRNLV